MWDFREWNTGQGTLSRINYYKHVFIFFPPTTPVCETPPHSNQCCSKDMKFPKLAKITKELWLQSINHHISSLLEVSCGMMNILCEFLSPEECAHPSGFIHPESSMGTSELPKFATALSKALHLSKLVAINPVKGYLFSPRAWHRAKPHPVQSGVSKDKKTGKK